MPLLSVARDGSEKRYGEAIGEGTYEVAVIKLNSKGRYILNRRSLVDTEHCSRWFGRIGPVQLIGEYLTLSELCDGVIRTRASRKKKVEDKPTGKRVKRAMRSSITF